MKVVRLLVAVATLACSTAAMAELNTVTYVTHDGNGDGRVEFADFLILSDNYGRTQAF